MQLIEQKYREYTDNNCQNLANRAFVFNRTNGSTQNNDNEGYYITIGMPDNVRSGR